jgi:hypothetical protein
MINENGKGTSFLWLEKMMGPGHESWQSGFFFFPCRSYHVFAFSVILLRLYIIKEKMVEDLMHCLTQSCR